MSTLSVDEFLALIEREFRGVSVQVREERTVEEDELETVVHVRGLARADGRRFLDRTMSLLDTIESPVVVVHHYAGETVAPMEQKEIYSVGFILSEIKRALILPRGEITLGSDTIKLTSRRYLTFLKCGVKCVECGIVGSFFRKEKHEDARNYHLNLYAVKEDGTEVLMTKDHIVPRSCGGSDQQSNLQTMCRICNASKDSFPEENVQVELLPHEARLIIELLHARLNRGRNSIKQADRRKAIAKLIEKLKNKVGESF